MNTVFKIVLVFLLCLPLFHLKAQENSYTQRKNVGKYQIELSGCCGTIDFHLYNYSGRPVRGFPLKGYVDLFYPDGSQIIMLLQQYEQSEFLSASVVYPGFRSLRISIIIGDEKISALFNVEHYRMVKNSQVK